MTEGIELCGIKVGSTFDENKFVETIDKFRSPHLWETKNGSWYLKHASYK